MVRPPKGPSRTGVAVSERTRTNQTKAAKDRGQRSAEVQLGFDLLPRHAGFPFIALDRTAKFNQIFDVLETLVQSTHLGSQRFERRFLKRGRVTHKPSSDP